jgi:metal-responsive CopG/Arc/MetJ family transcriptional regulator
MRDSPAETKQNDKSVLLNLPVQILKQVDMAVREQGVTRSQFLRQAIERICTIIR